MPLRLLLHARDDNVTAATASADAAVAATDAVLAVAVVVICFFGAIIDENDAPRKSAPTAARSFTAAHADHDHLAHFFQSAMPPRSSSKREIGAFRLDFPSLADWASICTTPAAFRLWSWPEWAGWGPLDLASPP
jgi:hypothetical protein